MRGSYPLVHIRTCNMQKHRLCANLGIMTKPGTVKSLPPGLLSSRFQSYFEEMERCKNGKAYWALLHIVVCLPDICAALQSARGNSRTKSYISWCERYLP